MKLQKCKNGHFMILTNIPNAHIVQRTQKGLRRW